MSFVHLHCHTHYSLLDGLPKPKAYLKKAASTGARALAITDHGNLYGAIEFYKAAREVDIKPIIGMEAYTARTSRHSKQAGIDNQIGHMILLARTQEGYENLMQLSTRSHLEGFYYKPRIDWELLKEYGNGLTLLTGCLNGDVPKLLLANKPEEAEQLLREFQSMVGDENVFLELQDHPHLMEQGILNERLIALSGRTGVPLVGTNDCHCIEKEDREAHDILLCVQTGAQVNQENRFRMEGEFYMRSPEDMARAFSETPQAVASTLAIADSCSLDIPINGKSILPVFDTPFQKTDADYLRELCLEGVAVRYGDSPAPEVMERLDYELGVVHTMGFDAYFLIVQDFVAFAKNSGIVVGPGRGSAAGSIIAYCLLITDIDPLRYGLLFERFLNPERVSMPDIDIDFADNRRDEVLNYVVQKYGKDRVAQVITFGTMAARAAVRDVGRALGMVYGDVDVIAKLIPARPGIKLKEAMEQEPELRSRHESNPSVKKLLDLAIKLEGVVRHASVHACAVVISDLPLVKYTPLQTPPGASSEDAVITQYDMHCIEAIGLLKMDFLGLKNLTILEYAMEIIRRTKQVSIVMEELPLDDTATFELMARGDTTGVFQFESPGMRRYLKQLKPSRFEDLIAMNALYRPGPMDWIPSYIQGKHNEKKVKYFHSSFESILKETYGVAVYQEQILQLSQLVAGFSLGEADILRKAVGKKIPALLAEQRVKFVEGAMTKGHTKAFATEVFDKVIEPFAGYGFNKAHATCYAMIAYRTAYLKSHFPAEFMAALMTSDRDNTDRIVIEINEANSMGIEVLPPSLNESMANFTVVDDTHIRFGLAAIKGVGITTIEALLEIRSKGGPFKSVEEVARRVPCNLLNKKTLEALAYSGALDDLAERRAVVASLEEISSYSRQVQQHSNEGQTDIFGMLSDDDAGDQPSFKLSVVPPANHLQRLNWEKKFLGLYVSGHPLQGLSRYLKRKVSLISSLTPKNVGKPIKIAGILTAVKKVVTKAGTSMAYMTLEDSTGRIEVIVFPNTFAQFRGFFEAENVVLITGKLEARRGDPQVVCQIIQAISLETMIEKARAENLYNPEERVALVPPLSFAPNPEAEESGEFEPEASVPIPEIAEVEDEAVAPKAIPPRAEVSEEPLVIRLADQQTSSTHLSSLKQLLLQNQGRQPVEIHVDQGGLVKRIKVPFGVKVTPELESRIAELNAVQ